MFFRALDLIDLCEAERLECLKLISIILTIYYRASSVFKRLIIKDERFRFFLRYCFKSLLTIALAQFGCYNNIENTIKKDDLKQQNSRLNLFF